MRVPYSSSSRQLGASSATMILAILLVLLVGVTIYLLVTYSSQNSILESRQEELSRAKYDMERLSDSLEQAEREKSALSGELNVMRRKIEEFQTRGDDSLNALKTRIRRYGIEKAKHEKELQVQKIKLAECEVVAGKLEEANRRNAGLVELAQNLQQCEAELKDTKGALDAAQVDSQVNAQNRQELVRLTKELEACGQKLDQAVSAEELASSPTPEEKIGVVQEPPSERVAESKRSEVAVEEKSVLETELAQLKKKLKNCQGDLHATEGTASVEELAEVKNTYKTLIHDLKQEVSDKQVTIERFKNKVTIQIVGKILFPSGSSHITPKGRMVLSKLQKTFSDVKHKQIYVIGHTDDVDIKSSCLNLVPSNWELSAKRAASVVRYLIDVEGVSPERLAAVGRSYYEPVGNNDTSEGRAQNRRVEIVVSNGLRLNE